MVDGDAETDGEGEIDGVAVTVGDTLAEAVTDAVGVTDGVGVTETGMMLTKQKSVVMVFAMPDTGPTTLKFATQSNVPRTSPGWTE